MDSKKDRHEDTAFGWWTTGRDQAAIDLLHTVCRAIEEGTIPSRIAYVFSSREPGESPYSDRLMELAEEYGIPVVSRSAVKFLPDLRKNDREAWRNAYHGEVLRTVKDFPVDVVVLAGYMWVVSREVCEKLSIINLHPAAPGGPAGTWQEVIWQLLEHHAEKTGIMMHLVTSELDKGPAVTYCTFPIAGGRWVPLWRSFNAEMEKSGIEKIKSTAGESEPLFAAIREEGVKRELPLIVQTLRAFAHREISIRNGRLYDGIGNELYEPCDLSDAIEKTLAGGRKEAF